jgi:GrpE
MPTTPDAAVIVRHVSDAPSPWLLAAIAAAVALLGVALGRLSTARRPDQPLQSAPAVASVVPAAVTVAPAPAADSRMDQLALACLHLADSVSSPVLQADIDRALRTAGYQPLDPTGQAFDPSVHEAVERRRTTDARTHNLVAATYRSGWYGHGHVLRSPEVAVYRLEASTS